MIERKRRQKLAKYAAFLSKAEWIKIRKLLQTKVNEVAQVLGKNLLVFGSEMWHMFDFSWTIVIIIVQSGLKLYDFTILAARVEAEQDCNPFAQRLLSSRTCLIELKTEFELEQVISMQLRNRFHSSEKRQNSPS